jgi:hypothetical protein
MLEFVSIDGSTNSYRVIVGITFFLFTLRLNMKVSNVSTPE